MQGCSRAVVGWLWCGFSWSYGPRRTAAHGEVAQDAFIRSRTVAFYDVHFSDTHIQRGEALTITGKFFLLQDGQSALASPGSYSSRPPCPDRCCSYRSAG